MCKEKNRIIAKRIGIFILILLLIPFIFTYRVVLISGESMEPTLRNKSIHLVKKEKNYYNNNIVVFKKDGDTIVKRIVASAHDSITLNQSGVWINDVLQKYYVYQGEDKKLCLSSGEYFVLGDNTYNSVDSRDYGTITKNMIVGKLVE